jgi:hypothetical protein
VDVTTWSRSSNLGREVSNAPHDTAGRLETSDGESFHMFLK